MCPACLASLGMLVAAGVASAGAATALVAARIRNKKTDDQFRGDTDATAENRIQG